MALTLPAEVATEKDKQGHSPLLLIDFVDLTYYVATKAYTLDLTGGGTRTYNDLTQASKIGALTHRIPDGVNRISSTANMRITLLDFRGSLRTNIIASAPDLTDSTVRVYLKFDTDNEDEANLLKIFDGVIAEYDTSIDTLELQLETVHFRNLKSLPAELLKDAYTDVANIDDIGKPLQYGDFNWADDPLFTADINQTYAIAPFVKNDGTHYFFSVASHEMNEFPTAGNISDTSGDAYLFLRRDGLLIHVTDATAVVTNSASNAEIKIRTLLHLCYTFIWPSALYTGGTNMNPSDGADAIDKAAATNTVINGTSGEELEVHTINIDALDLSIPSDGVRFFIYFVSVFGSSPYGTVKIKKKSDDSEVGIGYTIDSGTSLNAWVQTAIFDALTIGDINDHYLEVAVNSGRTVGVAGVTARIGVQEFDPVNDELAAYVRCKGREFSGTWGSRKTSGDPIDHPIDMVESLVRDEFSLTEINTSAIDDVAGEMPSYKVNASLFKQEKGADLLNDIAKQFNIGVLITPDGQFSLMMPDESLDFTDAGSGTPNNEDIINDSETITDDAFDQHPILLDSFELSRTNPRGLMNKLSIEYERTFLGQHLKETNVGTGDVTVYRNKYIAHETTANGIKNHIHNWNSIQRWIVNLTTFLNAIGFQLGDIKNIRNDDLNDNMLIDTVNTQKWMLLDISIVDYGLIKLKFIEIGDPGPPS